VVRTFPGVEVEARHSFALAHRLAARLAAEYHAQPGKEAANGVADDTITRIECQERSVGCADDATQAA
jgi:hypothetical protein